MAKKKKAAKDVAAPEALSGDSDSLRPDATVPPGSAVESVVSRYQGFEPQTVNRRQLIGADYNPRYLGPAQKAKLKRSIEKFKLVEPVVWNKRSGRLVGGHQRVTIIDQLEGTDDYLLTVSAIDVDDETEKAINIALNNPELQGQYDQDLLHDVVGSLFESSPGLVKDAGLDNASLAFLFGDEFLLDAPKRQAELDAPIVADLTEMYEAGKEKASPSRQPSVPPGDPEPRQSAVPQSNHSSAVPTGRLPGEQDPANRVFGISADDADPSQPTVVPPDPEKYACGWTKQDFKDRRKQFGGDKKLLDEADVFFSVVFDSSEQGTAWLRFLGLDPGVRTVDLTTFCAVLNIDLEAAVKAHREDMAAAEREIEAELGIDQPSGPDGSTTS